MPQKLFTDEDRQEVVRLRMFKHWSFKRIAAQYGCTTSGAYIAYQNGLRDGAYASGISDRGRQYQADAAARVAEIPIDTRGLTARFFGDPVPERSALYRKLQH